MIPRGISYPDIDNRVLHPHPKVHKEVYLVGTIYGRSIQSPLDQAFWPKVLSASAAQMVLEKYAY